MSEKAKITDPEQLIGMYFRHNDNLRIYRIEAIDKEGVNVTEVEGMHLPAMPVEQTDGTNMITWAALRRFYNLLIHADDMA